VIGVETDLTPWGSVAHRTHQEA